MRSHSLPAFRRRPARGRRAEDYRRSNSWLDWAQRNCRVQPDDFADPDHPVIWLGQTAGRVAIRRHDVIARVEKAVQSFLTYTERVQAEILDGGRGAWGAVCSVRGEYRVWALRGSECVPGGRLIPGGHGAKEAEHGAVVYYSMIDVCLTFSILIIYLR